MGGSADENQANEFVSASDTTRRNAARNKKQREDAFAKAKWANETPDYKMGSHKKEYDAVNRNINLAKDLESRASKSEINVPIPTMGTIAMNTISSINYKNQANQLRAGGNAVYDEQGTYRGVVGKDLTGMGRGYWGDADYSPIGRSQGATFDSATGTYKSSQIQTASNDSGSESSNNTPTNTQVAVENKTDSTTSLDPKAKRSLLASKQGGANTRYFIRT